MCTQYQKGLAVVLLSYIFPQIYSNMALNSQQRMAREGNSRVEEQPAAEQAPPGASSAAQPSPPALASAQASLPVTAVSWQQEALEAGGTEEKNGASQFANDSDESVLSADLATPSEATLAALLTAARDEDRDIRGDAIVALGKLAKAAPRHAEAVLDTLLTAVRDSDDDVRGAAIVALGELIKASPYLASKIVLTR